MPGNYWFDRYGFFLRDPIFVFFTFFKILKYLEGFWFWVLFIFVKVLIFVCEFGFCLVWLLVWI